MADDEHSEQKDSAQDTSESPAVDPGATRVGARAAGSPETQPEGEAAGDRDATRVGTPVVASPEGEQSPADADRAAKGLPEESARAPLHGAPSETEPTGTGPGGEVRGGYGLGATGPGGETDVRGPTETGAATSGQSPAQAQRRADEEAQDAFSENPHLFVAGAFAGGFVVAQVLKRIGGGD